MRANVVVTLTEQMFGIKDRYMFMLENINPDFDEDLLMDAVLLLAD